MKIATSKNVTKYSDYTERSPWRAVQNAVLCSGTPPKTLTPLVNSFHHVSLSSTAVIHDASAGLTCFLLKGLLKSALALNSTKMPLNHNLA